MNLKEYEKILLPKGWPITTDGQAKDAVTVVSQADLAEYNLTRTFITTRDCSCPPIWTLWIKDTKPTKKGNPQFSARIVSLWKGADDRQRVVSRVSSPAMVSWRKNWIPYFKSEMLPSEGLFADIKHAVSLLNKLRHGKTPHREVATIYGSVKIQQLVETLLALEPCQVKHYQPEELSTEEPEETPRVNNFAFRVFG